MSKNALKNTGIRRIATTRSARGFTLMEIVIVVALAGFFMVMLGHVFIASVQLGNEAPRATDRLARWELLTHQLRLDVWSARAMNKKPDSVELTQTDHRIVRWEFDASANLIRRRVIINDHVTEEIEVPSPVALLRVDVNDDARELSLLASEGSNKTLEHSGEQRLSFISQVNLANAAEGKR